ncbi:DNA helicase [Gordonia phage Evaa]|nr:DNA helicase [Gordonia phage Evaa]
MTASALTPRVLRPYQIEAVEAVHNDWAANTRRVGVVLPTGAGKSTVIAALAVAAFHRGQRVVLLAHRAELLDQMLDAVRAVDPTIPEREIGMVRAERDDHSAAIVAATLQTLANAHRRQALGHRDVILWDEVHHAGAEGWHATFTDLGGYGDGQFMCGFTATMSRGERASTIGLGDVMQKISYQKDLLWAIESGYLVRPHGLTVRVENLNTLNDVRNVAGDFHQGQLAEIMEAATEYVVEAITKHAADRQMIVFAASVDAANTLATALTDSGIPAAATTGDMGYAVRQPIYDRFRSGELRALVTVMVLTEGADFPMCDAVVLARPTRSKNLYSQMVGRALRLWEGKTDALVLDLSGSTRTMKLINLAQLLPGAATRSVTPEGIELDEDDYEDDPEPAIKVRRQGPVDMVTIDLLSGDDTLWLETPAGVPFVPLRDNWVAFVWPEDGVRPTDGQNVGWCPGFIRTRRGFKDEPEGGWATADGTEQYMTLADALHAAEEFAVERLDQQLPSRNASWRRSQAPSEGQLRMAKRLGLPMTEDFTKARVSDEISIALASKVLDPAMETAQ